MKLQRNHTVMLSLSAIAAVLFVAASLRGDWYAAAVAQDDGVATPFVVTATPTAADVFEAATRVAEQTELAETVGTATPVPLNWVLATETPTPWLVVATPTAENEATAAVMSARETAIALTTGTPDPRRTVVTATPEPGLVYVTPTARPDTVIAAATLSAQQTARAETEGTPTPFPDNWRVARVVIARDTAPAELTAIAATTAQPESIFVWTATPRPPRRAQATATPVAISVADITPTATPEATPIFPADLVGKILFLSDRYSSNPRRPNAFAINPDGTGLQLLTSTEFHTRAQERDAYSASRQYWARALREESGVRTTQIFYSDANFGSKRQMTYFGAGVAWDPAWSPTENLVAFVSNESRNDEIWIGGPDLWPAQQLTKNDWEWDKSPSFSPDGETIVFMSNRVTGRQQLWLMDKDGGNVRMVTSTDFEMWDPVWVKYAD